MLWYCYQYILNFNYMQDPLTTHREEGLISDPKPMRPAILYCAIFTWNAITGGRFIAPYLAENAHLSNSQIGLSFSIPFAAIALTSGMAGHLADEWERKTPHHGRIQVLRLGIAWGTLVTIVEGVGNKYAYSWCQYAYRYFPDEHELSFHFFIFWWNLFMRCCYAISYAFTNPVLDGLTIAHLKCEGGGRSYDHDENTRRYGKERLHGAIWWGLANVVIGICADKFGLDTALCSLTVITTLLSFFTLSAYEASMQYSSSSPERSPLISPTPHQNIANTNEIEERIAERKEGVKIDLPLSSRDDSSRLSHRSISIDSHRDCNLDSSASSPRIDVSWCNLLCLAFATPYQCAFIVAFFFLNIGMAVVENLVFLFYEETLGGSSTMCGITVLFTVAMEVPIFYAAPNLLRTLGSGKMLGISCGAFILRTIGYVIVPRMGMIVFILDLLHGVSFAMSQGAGVAFMESITPETYEASGQGLLLFVRGLGATIGLLLGGVVQQRIGGRGMYAILSGLTSFGLLIFIITTACTSNNTGVVTMDRTKEEGDDYDETHSLTDDDGQIARDPAVTCS